MTTDPNPWKARLRGVITLAIMSAFAVPTAYAFHGAIPYNQLKLPAEEQVSPMTWAPQGWKFFTREPQEEQPFAYALQADGSWSPALKWPNARTDNLLGLGREGRVQGVELGLLLQDMTKSSWKECDESPIHCLDASTRRELRNASPHPTLCGTIGVVLQEPVPFAWREAGAKAIMPSRVAKLDVKC